MTMGRFACNGLVGAAVWVSLWSTGHAVRKASRQDSAQVAGVPLLRAEQSHAIADEWMVAFDKDTTDATLDAFCSQNGLCKSVGHPDEGGIPFVVMKGSEKTLESTISARSNIAYVEQNAEAEDFEEEVTVSEEASWGVGAVGVQSASNKGRGVNVYVLDSGVRVRHPEFGGRAIPLYDASFSPPKVCDPTDWTCAADPRGHGTHVAGSVGGATHGVAPESTIWAMQRGHSLSDGYASIDWLVQNKETPAVLQMSWGTSTLSSVGKAAVDAAVAAMITVTVASGNSRQDACQWTFAGVPNAIAVASSDSTNRRSPFSNFGACIDIFAPGSSITSADYRGGLSVKSGTSMAAPHVAGGAALVLGENPGMSPAGVLQELVSNSLPEYIYDARSDNNYFLWVGENRPNL